MHRSIPPFVTFCLKPECVADLRSDHAGEHGAVAIYCGILRVTRNDSVRRFARQHLRTEMRHRRFFERWLPREVQSRLLPVWWAAGWSLGAVSALFGPRGVFQTIAAVESFVETHYQGQIRQLQQDSALRPLASVLQSFCDEEVEHQHDAERRLDKPASHLARAWRATVGAGSSLGVLIARRI